MPRITVGRNSRLAALLMGAVLGLALATGASADTPPGRGPNGGPAPTPTPSPADDCAVLRVRLNGTQPATRTCLAIVQGARGMDPSALAQDTTRSDCASTDVRLYQNTNFGGKRVCFYGEGYADLRDEWVFTYWPCFCYKHFDNALSSFETGAFYVNFYDANYPSATGDKLRYASYQWRSSMPYGWNDRVSSLCLWGPTVSCP